MRMPSVLIDGPFPPLLGLAARWGANSLVAEISVLMWSSRI